MHAHTHTHTCIRAHKHTAHTRSRASQSYVSVFRVDQCLFYSSQHWEHHFHKCTVQNGWSMFMIISETVVMPHQNSVVGKWGKEIQTHVHLCVDGWGQAQCRSSEIIHYFILLLRQGFSWRGVHHKGQAVWVCLPLSPSLNMDSWCLTRVSPLMRQALYQLTHLTQLQL